MKGIMTRAGAVLILLALGLASAYAFNLFGLFSADDDNSIDAVLSHIPADTSFFVGGHWVTEGREILDSWSQLRGYQAKDALEMLDQVGDGENPILAFGAALFQDYVMASSQGHSNLLAHYGLPEGGAYTFYLHGAMPVLRVALEKAGAFDAVLNQAILESNTTPILKQIDGIEVRTWRLTPDGDEEWFELAIAINQGLATVTLFNHTDTAVSQAQRLGLTEVSDSLAEQGDWEALAERYDYDETYRGFVDIKGVAATLLTGSDSLLRRDLTALMPEQIAQMDANLSASQCGTEVYALAEQVPRLAFGSEAISATSDRLTQRLGMTLEMTNSELTSQLTRLPGSLPAFAGNGGDKLLAIALGLDVNALAPVATALWTQVTQRDYECQALAEAVRPLRQTNPAMIGLGAAMAQGVKGVAAAIYSLETSPASPFGLAGSALVSVSADNPSVLASLISASVPGMLGVNIPSDGTAVQVPVPMIPQPVFAAIKGKHLVLYTGEAAKAPADAMVGEPLNTRGIAGFALNYERLGNTTLMLLETPMLANSLRLGAGNMDACLTAYTSALQAAAMPLHGNYRDTFSSRGWDATLEATSGPVTADFSVPTGTFQAEALNEGCNWYPSGTETINPDGTGTFSERDASGQCDLYQSDYDWTVNGYVMEQTTTRVRSRETCTAEWAELPEDTNRCTLLGRHNGAYYCQYGSGIDATLVRYTQ